MKDLPALKTHKEFTNAHLQKLATKFIFLRHCVGLSYFFPQEGLSCTMRSNTLAWIKVGNFILD